MTAISTQADLSHFIQVRDDGVRRLELAVDGITCAACMSIIEDGVLDEPGIDRARLNLTNRRLAVEWTAPSLEPSRVVQRLARLGYRAYPFDATQAETEEAREARDLMMCLGVAAFATMNIMLLSVSVWAGNVTDITPETRDFFHWLSALIAIPAVAYAGRPFFRSALRALKGGGLNMDVPISLGVTLAVGMSLVETIHHASHAYFDSAVMLLTFLLVGRYLDQMMRRRTRAVATNLAALKAETAVKIVGDTELVEVPIGAIKVGDLVLVRPGERVTVDGRIVEGRGTIDQSLITGETQPVTVTSGASVYAGTLNLSGTLRIRVAAAGQGTVLDEVNHLMDAATDGRSRYLSLADRAARLYSPVVHVTAAATFLGWIALGLAWQPSLIIAITVLIITCPCALGLAVPTVQVVASGALFRRHILLASGDAIERFAEVDTVVFDKTGTLTLPEPRLVEGFEVDAALLTHAARLAAASRHPLARAFAEANGHPMPIEDAIEEPGQGMRTVIDGREARLGSAIFCGAEREAAAVTTAYPDASILAFRWGDRVAIYPLAQRLRPDAIATLRDLKAQGLRIAILSGDRAEVVAGVAATLGIDKAEGGLSPTGKIARLDAMKAEGHKVLMVGDGLNDAPALAHAHVSMSPISAVHLAQAAADAVFLGEGLKPVSEVMLISRRAHRLMRENLWLAVLYNAIAVPVAILGFVTPLIAALAMSGSSVIVTVNALRAARTASPGGN